MSIGAPINGSGPSAEGLFVRRKREFTFVS